MLTKAILPKTKADLIKALQAASFRSVEVYEKDRLALMPAIDRMKKLGASVIILS